MFFLNPQLQDEVYAFKCDRWLSDIAGTDVVLNAVVSRKRVYVPPKSRNTTTYEIAVTTGDISKAGAPSRVYLSLIDASGHREERQLIRGVSSKRPFQPGQVSISYEFYIKRICYMDLNQHDYN